MSPHLVLKGLRALEPLDNALVRVEALFNSDSSVLDIEYRLIDFWSLALHPALVHWLLLLIYANLLEVRWGLQ